MELRLRYPDWGARKLSVLLAREGIFLPRNTIHRIPWRHDLILEDDQHPPALQRFERKQPNELWEMDFKEPKAWPHAVGPLSMLDDHSRYLIALAVNGSTRGEPVHRQLEEAFQRCGVPDGGADGTRYSLVGAASPFRIFAFVGWADALRHSPILEWHPTSAYPRKGRALSWSAATRLSAQRHSSSTTPADLAR